MSVLPLSPDARLRLALGAYTALHEMSLGRARKDEWRTLADTLNIVKALCDLGKLDAVRFMPVVERALAGMVEAIRCDDGQFRIGPSGLAALREIVAAYDDAIGRFAARTISAAVARVMLTVANARKANPSETLAV
jgi:hypothetical protein